MSRAHKVHQARGTEYVRSGAHRVCQANSIKGSGQKHVGRVSVTEGCWMR